MIWKLPKLCTEPEDAGTGNLMLWFKPSYKV